MVEYFVDDEGIFDAGNNFHGASSTANLCQTCDRSCGSYSQNTGGDSCGPQDCMTCPPGKVIKKLYSDDTGECVNDVANSAVTAPPVLIGKRVFVTSRKYSGNLGGINGADAIFNQHASETGLGGAYKAWLSNGRTHPARSFNQHNIPYIRTDGVQVSESFNSLLDGQIDAAIDHDEYGQELVSKWGAWTGTQENDESERKHCRKWTNANSGDGIHGCTSTSYSAWSSCGENNCNSEYSLYCVEQ